ncbi:MAG: zinc ribbon domain-containing protein [Eubacterium sp.]|nr:zinc ribbon domain-containing protein [Eubacterium sp.]
METTNIIKTTMEPVDDGGRKYNIIYWITGIIGGITGLACGVVAIVFCLPLGLGAGWLIKNKLLDIKAYKFRDYTFKCYNMVPLSELTHSIIPELTRMNMTVELNGNGAPMISHNRIIYDFSYNDDMTFSIWWRKTLGGAFTVFDSIKMYRNISADMGIISYVIQQATQLPEYNNMGGQPDTGTYKFCMNCGTKYKEGDMFCTNCGTKLIQ